MNQNDPDAFLAMYLAARKGWRAGIRFRLRELAYDWEQHRKANQARMWRVLSYVQPPPNQPLSPVQRLVLRFLAGAVLASCEDRLWIGQKEARRRLAAQLDEASEQP